LAAIEAAGADGATHAVLMVEHNLKYMVNFATGVLALRNGRLDPSISDLNTLLLGGRKPER
jgi:ABC-type branched-subunit amino acid transport system ATPase component